MHIFTQTPMINLGCKDAIVSPGAVLQLERRHDLQIGKQQQIVRYPASDVQRLHTLGTGSFCNVFLVASRSQKKDFAMKHLNLKKISSSTELLAAAADLIMEAHLLSKLDHRNIIKLRGVSATPFSQSFEETEQGFFLLMDVMDETLQDRLRKWRNDPSCFVKKRNICGKLARKTKKLNLERMCERIETVALGIAKAMKYIHEQGILHRDLKPANVGFNKATGEVCIFDFGMARELEDCRNDEICGTPRYLAPEVLRGEGYSFKSDVYSFGLLLHEVVSLQQQKRPKKLPIKSQNDVWNACSALARPSLDVIPCRNVAYLVEDCLSDDLVSRPAFEVICMSLRSSLSTMIPDGCQKDSTLEQLQLTKVRK